MHSITEELGRLSGSRYYQSAHSQDPMIEQALRSFLRATMDEVRLWHANAYAKLVLALPDIDDADHFRQGLLRREVGGRIVYQNQRDHAAHTVNNYLLGWYLYVHCEAIRVAFARHFTLRGYARNHSSIFRSIWPFVSLLHDIGYLFEGSLDPLETGTTDEEVAIGSEVVDDYFQHRFWIQCSVDSIHERSRLQELSAVTIPQFKGRSLAAIADGLRELGNLEGLHKAVCKNRGGARAIKVERFPGDAFDLWELHYEHYGNKQMVRRIKWMRTAFEAVMWEGLDGSGLRFLDHGISGGLLLLLYSTFYFRVYFGLSANSAALSRDERDKRLVQKFQEKQYDPLWWFSGVLWATAATALHNIQQKPPDFKVPENLGLLRLEEDPLAYTGVLVDCLQEWDRYTVRHESVIGGKLPLQGADVRLGPGAGRIQIDYGNATRAKKIKESLNASLSGWKKLVEILG